MSDITSNAIACIGWGSLVWNPGDLPCRGGWHNDGPLLPIEFARESGGATMADSGDKITLVICPATPRVRTYWTLLDAADVPTARHQLARREYTKANKAWTEQNTGFWDSAQGLSHGIESATIATWAKDVGVDGAVWTNLDYGFKKSRSQMPTGDAIVAFLRALDAQQQPDAEGYVRRAPVQIDTPFRRQIEQQLGWSRRS